ncbi:hypothetical protein MTO96_039800, partial [Rhipicephalus appendiculatus]
KLLEGGKDLGGSLEEGLVTISPRRPCDCRFNCVKLLWTFVSGNGTTFYEVTSPAADK